MTSRYEAPDDDLDDPPVQCWHYEPGTPCDWDICRQPERLAVGDYGTDPAETGINYGQRFRAYGRTG